MITFLTAGRWRHDANRGTDYLLQLSFVDGSVGDGVDAAKNVATKFVHVVREFSNPKTLVNTSGQTMPFVTEAVK